MHREGAKRTILGKSTDKEFARVLDRRWDAVVGFGVVHYLLCFGHHYFANEGPGRSLLWVVGAFFGQKIGGG